jgi:hypothetical protein
MNLSFEKPNNKVDVDFFFSLKAVFGKKRGKGIARSVDNLKNLQ